MAENTNADLERQIIYSAFVRNHTKEGTFRALEKDLDRIKSLGTDILWMMPIQTVGEKERKGKDGSPYAIKDYREIEKSMGDWQDLKNLVDAAHSKGMKVIVDVVYNHTSPDSVLFETHPEWFYLDEKGNGYSLEKDWSDIIDLDYSHPELQEYQIETLKKFAGVVDGFRCDVASRVPASFWKKAIEECARVNPDLIWLAESCHLPFIKFCRDHGRVGESDSALFESFDLLYDYDAYPYQEAVFKEDGPISAWTEALSRQEAQLPVNYIKTRYLENHDTDRFAQYVFDPDLWKNWIALQMFLKGTPMIYEGQEQKESHRPSIFEQDPIVWREDTEASKWIAKCTKIHKSLKSGGPIQYTPLDKEGALIVERPETMGIFQLQDHGAGKIPVLLEDGSYMDQLSGKSVEISDGQIAVSSLPVIIRTEKE